MTDPRFAAEADAKVLRALEHIEEAQGELGCACQQLCPIIGGASQWKRARALYDRVHAEWYRVHAWAEKRRGRLDLDGSGRSALARTREVQAGDLIEGTKSPASDGGA